GGGAAGGWVPGSPASGRPRGAGSGGPPAVRRPPGTCARLTGELESSGREHDRLARRLRVEELVGFLRLLELPAVREELLHVHAAVGDELGALGLALLRERPRSDERHLPAQEIGAHVQGDLAPLADEARRAPRAPRTPGRGRRVRRRGG